VPDGALPEAGIGAGDASRGATGAGFSAGRTNGVSGSGELLPSWCAAPIPARVSRTKTNNTTSDRLADNDIVVRTIFNTPRLTSYCGGQADGTAFESVCAGPVQRSLDGGTA